MYHKASMTSYIYEIQLKIKQPFDDVNECWPLQKNTWPRWAATWYSQVILVSRYPVLTTVNWSQHWCATYVQYEFPYAPKRATKCEIEHWLPCGADRQAVYGHVITKFSGMGRFTYPWCSAGVLCARSSTKKPFLCLLFAKKNYVSVYRLKRKQNLIERFCWMGVELGNVTRRLKTVKIVQSLSVQFYGSDDTVFTRIDAAPE